MSLCDLNPFVDVRWNRFLKENRTAAIFHTTEWMRVIRDTYGFDCRVLATAGSDGSLTSGVPYCVVDSCVTGKRVVSLPFSDYCPPIGTNPEDLCRLLSGMKRIAAITLSGYAEVRGCGGVAPVAAGLRCTGRYLSHSIDLHDGIAAVERRYHKDCVRRRVRRAIAEGVKVIKGTESSLVDDFYPLLIMTRRRHGYPPPPKKWYLNLAKVVPSAQLSIAYYRGAPVAGIVTFRLHGTAYYKYGASDVRYHHLGAMPLLYSEMIREAVESGAVQVDLGRTEPSNNGLVEFKERFGAVGSVVEYWQMGGRESNGGPFRDFIGRAGRLVFSRTPLSLLPKIGAFLYPHVA